MNEKNISFEQNYNVYFSFYFSDDGQMDSTGMKFHEMVIPMNELSYDFYPDRLNCSGGWLGAILTKDNVRKFKFSDLQVKFCSTPLLRMSSWPILRALNQVISKSPSVLACIWDCMCHDFWH